MTFLKIAKSSLFCHAVVTPSVDRLSTKH